MPLEKAIERFRYLEEKKIIGELKRLFNFTDEPHFFQYSCHYSKDPYDEDSMGVAIDIKENDAKIKALGECIERYALQNIPENLILKSFNNLDSKAINPGHFVNFREQDLGYKRREYIEKLQDYPLLWVVGKEIRTNEEILIPAQLVYVPFHKDEPIIRSQISTGAAAHDSNEKAVLSGIFEAIERDSFMLAYLSRDNAPPVRLDKELKELEDYFARYYLNIRVFDITTDLEIPSFMCLNLDYSGEGPAVSVGLSSNFSSRKAILKSIIESQQSRQWLRSHYIQDKKPKVDDPSKIHSIKDRGYYWYPTRSIKNLDFLLHNNESKEIENDRENLSILDLAKHLAGKGVTSYVVDITPPEVRDIGFSIVKAILPELHPLFLYEDFPHLYSQRLDNHLTGRELNLVPHPFI